MFRKNCIVDHLELKQKNQNSENSTRKNSNQAHNHSSSTPSSNFSNNNNNSADNNLAANASETYNSNKKEYELFTALTWGHNDQRLFVACSRCLHILRVFKEIPKLSLLSQFTIKTNLINKNHVSGFVLPDQLKEQIKYCFTPTIKNIFPRSNELRKFISTPLVNNERLHCTLKRIDLKSRYDYYILYMEYLGGLVPLLSARKSSKIKPEFVIFDSFISEHKTDQSTSNTTYLRKHKELTNKKNNETYVRTNGCSSKFGVENNYNLDKISLLSSYSNLSNYSASKSTYKRITTKIKPSYARYLVNKFRGNTASNSNKNNSNTKMAIKKRLRKGRRKNQRPKYEEDTFIEQKMQLNNNLITSSKQNHQKKLFKRSVLVNIKSNLWGTIFRFYGTRYLPSFIGEIVYKTSLFHLQPRQMTITLENLTNLEKKTNFEKVTRVKPRPILQPETVPAVQKAITKPNVELNRTNSLKEKLKHYSKFSNTILGAIPNYSNSCLNVNYFTELKNIQNSKNQNSNSNNMNLSRSSSIAGDSDMLISTANELIESKFKSKNLNSTENSHTYSSSSTLTGDSSSSSSSESLTSLAEKLPKLCLNTDQYSLAEYGNEDDEYEKVVPGKYLISSSTTAATIYTNNFDEIQPLVAVSSPKNQKQQQQLKTPIMKKSISTGTGLSFILDFFRRKKSINMLPKHINNDQSCHEEVTVNLEIVPRNIESSRDSDFEDLEERIADTEDQNGTNYKKTRKTGKSKGILASKWSLKKKIVKINPANRSATKAKSMLDKNQIILHNKPPIWNESSQVYQLDFGGRVTQESAKNFQIEHFGKQVMQFGRIDTNAYTLDFQWPFSTVQAFSIALANITQRLK
jgi:hypothetical protein